jgi:hypothetical protein
LGDNRQIIGHFGENANRNVGLRSPSRQDNQGVDFGGQAANQRAAQSKKA